MKKLITSILLFTCIMLQAQDEDHIRTLKNFDSTPGKYDFYGHKTYKDSTGLYRLEYSVNGSFASVPAIEGAQPHYDAVVTVYKMEGKKEKQIGQPFKQTFVEGDCFEDMPAEVVKKALKMEKDKKINTSSLFDKAITLEITTKPGDAGLLTGGTGVTGGVYTLSDNGRLSVQGNGQPVWTMIDLADYKLLKDSINQMNKTIDSLNNAFYVVTKGLHNLYVDLLEDCTSMQIEYDAAKEILCTISMEQRKVLPRQQNAFDIAISKYAQAVKKNKKWKEENSKPGDDSPIK